MAEDPSTNTRIKRIRKRTLVCFDEDALFNVKRLNGSLNRKIKLENESFLFMVYRCKLELVGWQMF